MLTLDLGAIESTGGLNPTFRFYAPNLTNVLFELERAPSRARFVFRVERLCRRFMVRLWPFFNRPRRCPRMAGMPEAGPVARVWAGVGRGS
jgi:hypothetical protein